ncbi:MAG: 3-hydroxy-3-methylglutaryl CoA synthase [Ruminococcaceae bacterium]|nr:3-hydroxy-3-methylglutaryl CoA synthase [Oscillospiraceae bacterium]
MRGIVSFGGYVPFNRLKRDVLKAAFEKAKPKGERAVANYDEDSITMAVTAALECVRGYDTDKLDAAYFVSTTAPYREKQCATNMIAALDLKRSVRTADFANTLRAGTQAMLCALDSAACGKQTLIAAADMRMAYADGNFEANFGDGGAAFIIGDENVIAKFVDSASVAVDFHDQWRGENDKYVRYWEDRFAITQAYEPFMKEAVTAVLEKTGLKPADFSKIIHYAMTPRYQAQIAAKLGFTPEQIQDSLYDTIGNTGVANVPMMLVAALEEAKPGDKLLVVAYSEGVDALVFEVTEEIANLVPRRGIKSYLEHKRNTMNYEKFLRWRGMIECEGARRPAQQRSSLPDYLRNYDKNYALYGHICTECGTPQFPPLRKCIKCKAVDKMEKYRFYGKTGRITTFAIDYLGASIDPPTLSAIVDFEGGGRMLTNVVDCDQEQIHDGMEVEMCYRKLFDVEGIHTYFWKAVPKLI